MNIDDILSEIISDIADGKELDIKYYCTKYPEHEAAIKEKLRIANFIKKNLAPEDLSGKQLGEYYLMREIGRGGMGIVYLAIHSRLSRLTAIKVLPAHFLADKKALKSFQDEAQIIAKFNHPNIVPIYSIDEDIGIHYISMGYVLGISLKDLIDKLRHLKTDNSIKVSQIREILAHACDQDQSSGNSITLKRDEKFWAQSYISFVATISKEIASALSYAHENGIFHGDIKPSNILLNRDAIPMIVDFGLSRSFKAFPKSKPEDFSGTLAYAAPEQIKNGTISAKTDIWSMGSTIYELLTLKNPFASNTVKNTADNVLSGNPPLPRSTDKKIPIELEAITLKCLETQYENRYASATDLANDLKNYLELKPIKAKPIGLIGRFQKIVKRHPVAALIIIVLLCAGIGFSAIAYKTGLYQLIDKDAHLELNKMIQEASSLQLNSNWDGAKVLYQRALDKAKTLPFTEKIRERALEGLGGVYYGLGNGEQAESFYKKCLEMNPKNIQALEGLASLYGYLFRDYDKSLIYYNKILSYNPKDISAINNYADSLIKLTRVEDALKFFANKCKDKDIANNQLVKICVQSAIQAVIFYPKIYESKGLSIKNYDDLKKIMLSSGFESDYIEDFITQFKRQCPWFAENVPLKELRKESSKRLYEQYFGARTDYQEDNSNPRVALDSFNRGLAYAKKGDRVNALKEYDNAIKDDPYYISAYFGRGSLYLERGDFEKASADFNKIIEIDKSNYTAYSYLGLVEYQRKNYSKAIEHYNKSIELFPTNVDAFFWRGLSHYCLRNFTQAINDLTKAIELQPKFPLAYFNRATAYYEIHEYDKAWHDVNEVKKVGGLPDQFNEGFKQFIEALERVSHK